jgi:hypothetical protein
MTWTGVAIGGASLIGGLISSSASKSAANTQAQAANNAAQISQKEFNTITQQETPYMGSGYGALSALDWGLGLTPLSNQQAVSSIGNPGGQQSAPSGQYHMAPNGALTPFASNGALTNLPYMGGQPGQRAGKADGGVVSGPGGPRSDSVPINASNGEFVVNANAVSHPGVLDLLHKINAGHFANGGLVGNPPVNPHLPPNWQGNRPPMTGTGQPTTGTGGYSGTPNSGLMNLNGVDINAQNTGGLGYGSLTTPFTTQNWQQLSPMYNFDLQQGRQGVLNGDASGQGALSGAAAKDLMNYNTSNANNAFGQAFNQYQTQQGNVFSRLFDVAQLGQNAAANTGQQGTALAGQQAQSAQNIGSAQAAGQIGAANAWSGALSSAAPWLSYGGGGGTAVGPSVSAADQAALYQSIPGYSG